MDPGDLKVSGHLPSLDTWTPTKQQVMSLVAEHYRNKRYYDQTVPSNIAISRLSPDPVYACTLETLVEERVYGKGLQPHDGSPIEPQPLPALWDTKVDVPGGYEDKSFTFRMRGTEVVRTCPTCKGNRRIICTGCRGAGRLRCGACGGSGKNCTCDGGYWNCQICNGLREVECPACRGY